MKVIRLKIATGAFALWLAGGNAVPAFSQQIDPALTGAVTAQTLELKSLHDKRRKTPPTRRVRCRTFTRSNVQGNW